MQQKSKMPRQALEHVAEVFRVFSEATRLAILQELLEGEHNVNELVDRLGTTQANISKQLRVLHEAGLIAREKRGNQVFYWINDDIVHPLCTLVCEKLNRDLTVKQDPYDFSI